MIKCNVSVCGTVSKAAVVRNGKGRNAVYYIFRRCGDTSQESGINKTVIVSCIMDGDDSKGIVVGNRIELKGVLTLQEER